MSISCRKLLAQLKYDCQKNIDSNQNHNMKCMRRFMRFNQKTAPVILFFLIAAMLCIPLCSRADYSGVLSYTKMMKITREDGTVDSLKVPLFTVDYNGSISVESMKDTPYYSWANKCDYQYKDGMLKCDEIILFLSYFNFKDIETDGNTAKVYYQEVNENGVVVKICLVMGKHDRPSGESTVQFLFEFDDEGNLTTEIIYCLPGTEYEGTYTYNLATGYVKAVLDDGTVKISRPMKPKNYDNARSLARKVMNQKETLKSKLRRLLIALITGDMSLLAELLFSRWFLPVLVFFLLIGLGKLSKRLEKLIISKKRSQS